VVLISRRDTDQRVEGELILRAAFGLAGLTRWQRSKRRGKRTYLEDDQTLVPQRYVMLTFTCNLLRFASQRRLGGRRESSGKTGNMQIG
jgi:hypothetical protein